MLYFFLIVNELCNSVIFNKLLHKTIILSVSISALYIYTPHIHLSAGRKPPGAGF